MFSFNKTKDIYRHIVFLFFCGIYKILYQYISFLIHVLMMFVVRVLHVTFCCETLQRRLWFNSTPICKANISEATNTPAIKGKAANLDYHNHDAPGFRFENRTEKPPGF